MFVMLLFIYVFVETRTCSFDCSAEKELIVSLEIVLFLFLLKFSDDVIRWSLKYAEKLGASHITGRRIKERKN